MIRILKLVLLAIVLFPGVSRSAQITQDKVYFKDRVIVAKGDKQFAPFEFINEEGKPDGFSVELFAALMKRLGISYTLELDDWGKVQQELAGKKIDLAIGMIYSRERAQKVKFGIPHCMISYNIICRKDNDYVNLESLAGKQIIVQNMDRAHEYLKESGLTDKVILVEDIDEAIQMLASGKGDAVISFDVSSFYFVRKGHYRNLVVHLTDIAPERYSIVVNTDNEELLYLLNAAIYQMKIDGEYDRIYYKWFGVYEKTGINKVIWYVLGILGAILLILILFIRLLRAKVREATGGLKLKNDEMISLVENLRKENRMRLAIEKNLIEAKEKAEESDRLKSAFLANMSHEIRTPLNAIVGFSSIVCEMNDPVERAKVCEIINKNNDLLLQLISDILDLSKIESGILTMNHSSFELGELCRQVMASVNSGTNHPNVRFVENIAYDCTLCSDQARVNQVITNFMTNAVKFTKRGTITLSTVRTDDGNVEISVTDTGIGIDPDKLQAVFERFVKLNSFSQGTGLGLSICKNIIDKLGGTIGVESESGKGSRFWIRLPVAEDSEQK